MYHEDDPTENLLDALAELPEPDWLVADPLTWPAEWDDDCAALGPPRGRDECWDDQSGYQPDSAEWAEYRKAFGITDAATLAELRRLERTDWERFLATPGEVPE